MLGSKSNDWRYKVELFVLTRKVVKDLRNVAVISLAGELEQLIKILFLVIWTDDSLVLDIDLNVDCLRIWVFDASTLSEIEACLWLESLKQILRQVLITQSVSAHLKLVEVFSIR